MTRRFSAILLAVALMSGTPTAVGAQAGPSPPRSTALPPAVVRAGEAARLPAGDAIEIHELINRMYLAEDLRDRQALRDAVTADFLQEHSAYGPVRGGDAFADFVLANPAAFDNLRHQAVNIITRRTGPDRAEAVSYLLVMQVRSEGPQAPSDVPRLVGHGVVNDRLVKQDGRWRIQRRIYDQIRILPEFAPDTQMRDRAGQSVAKQ